MNACLVQSDPDMGSVAADMLNLEVVMSSCAWEAIPLMKVTSMATVFFA